MSDRIGVPKADGGGEEHAYAPEMIPLSLCDYHGEPAVVLFFSGCNYRCGYCQNLRIRVQEASHRVSVSRIIDYLEGCRLASACKVTGGEPLLQPVSLDRIARKAKSLGLKFGIDTNGTMPDRLSTILPLLDLVSIDVKTALNDAEYALVTGVASPRSSEVAESIRIALSSRAYVDLRMVVIPGVNDRPEIARSIGRRLKELGYEEKAAKGEASFNLVEFVPENSGSEEYASMRNPSVGEMKTLASLMRIGNIRITHRALGYFVKPEDPQGE